MTHIIEHIYIHIPFCIRKCNYCSFYSVPYEKLLCKNYLKALQEEIKLVKQEFVLSPKTIYFGGGTPSLLSSAEITSVTDLLNVDNVEEITLEVNPFHISEEYLSSIKKTLVNRLSIGVQSFNTTELKMLGRIHSSQQAERVIQLVKENSWKNVSIDLMFGLPNQTYENLSATVLKAIELNPEHISLYCLSLEADVPLYKKKQFVPHDDIVADMYRLIREKLIHADYLQYEISNFSLPDYQSKHNLSYWNSEYYLGLGAGATGYIHNFRYQNPADINEYFSMISHHKLYGHREILSSKTQEKEFIFLQLRKMSGLSLSLFKEKFDHSFLETYKKQVDYLMKNKVADVFQDQFVILPEAYFISDAIFSEFM